MIILKRVYQFAVIIYKNISTHLINLADWILAIQLLFRYELFLIYRLISFIQQVDRVTVTSIDLIE